MTTKICRSCGTQFQVPYPSSKKAYCSGACRPKTIPPAPARGRLVEWVQKTCTCGETFEVPPWVDRQGKGKYCSHPCSVRDAKHLRATRSGYGRQPLPDRDYVAKDGYVWVYLSPDARPAGWSHHRYPKHRQVMRQMLGRDLLPGENVHHINGDKGDNRPENLELWVTNQPKGKRAQDALAWAYEIIDRYEGMSLD